MIIGDYYKCNYAAMISYTVLKLAYFCRWSVFQSLSQSGSQYPSVYLPIYLIQSVTLSVYPSIHVSVSIYQSHKWNYITALELHYGNAITLRYQSVSIIYLCVLVSHSIMYLSISVCHFSLGFIWIWWYPHLAISVSIIVHWKLY